MPSSPFSVPPRLRPSSLSPFFRADGNRTPKLIHSRSPSILRDRHGYAVAQVSHSPRTYLPLHPSSPKVPPGSWSGILQATRGCLPGEDLGDSPRGARERMRPSFSAVRVLPLHRARKELGLRAAGVAVLVANPPDATPPGASILRGEFRLRLRSNFPGRVSEHPAPSLWVTPHGRQGQLWLILDSLRESHPIQTHQVSLA